MKRHCIAEEINKITAYTKLSGKNEKAVAEILAIIKKTAKKLFSSDKRVHTGHENDLTQDLINLLS